MFNLVFGFLLLSGDISCFIRIPKNVEFQNKDVTNVKISQGSRTKRSIGRLSHPDWYSLDLDVEGSNVHLHLFRNDDVMTDIPILKLEEDGITEIYSEDQEESVFYQDAVNGAFVVVQYNRTQSQHVFGIFHLNENNYILQKDARNPIPMYSGVNQFEVVKENQINFKLADFLQTSEETMIHQTNQGHHREKRAIDSNQVELFIVCDYSVYKFWYDQSDKTTASQKDTDADLSVRQYYAFLVNGMDAMYKNIQTTSYSISILFAGILIVKLVDNSTWTENTRNTSISPHTVNAELAISHFNLWINTYSGSLPNFDHAMLFTRYDLEWKGSTEPQGLVFTNSICGTSSQSIVEDKFNFIIITVASHLLGHSLNALHDGDGNNCSASDAYIMAPSFEPQEGKTATHPWIFSNCSTDYFTTKIDELDGSNTNCMKTLGSGFDPTALTPYDQNLLGLKYDVDSQCKMVYGEESYFCRSIYENNYASICTLMYCRKPGDTSCYPTIAGDGTLCGNRKYCVSGVCTQDNNATEAKEECLYGDDRGIVLNEGNWTCAEIVERAPNKCESVHNKCCASCAYYFKATTESQSEKLNVFVH